jgi:hypothetical protein
MFRRSRTATIAVIALAATTVAHARAAAPPPQVVSDSIRRVGAHVSPGASIDGVDERVDVDIAIIAQGLDANHEDLNVVGAKSCSTGRLVRGANHQGTSFAGLAAAVDNDIGVVGIAPGARLWAVRTDGSKSALLCALKWLTRNADVIDVAVSAWRYARTRPIGDCTDPPETLRKLRRAFCDLSAAGVTYVASAGTNSVDTADFEPQAYPEVITVSGMADNDGAPGGLGGPLWECAPHETDDHFIGASNFGAPIDISAPGACAATTYPGNDYAAGAYVLRGGSVQFAAAYVAGAAALILANDPDATPQEVRDTLVSLAEPGPILGDPDAFPEGVLDVSTL